ncbi:hypothetical protein DICPUDRAFT_34837 [Dictyostelium purpureum]|uniref:Bms1-type G domain-containing protein n=1 Tax=Dictyostelium purpureum TaxID=5786 RepID=F0ZNE2_DICPU|nr:uncharacterized protein DICPUDRAFT_34837 [Dictyostelium purpureum]EGC34550.1 hypothetical protein DICPUDRAFT_34837 [Dictyostelium purpureum]|eukprot:XP_003288926.1 hypothetical protein DICPUDRAFT_34837 [Dictyostelium purpureum]
MEHRHRSGDLKQQNKSFKAGKHDSKGAIKRRAQGKIETNARQSIKNLAQISTKEQMKNKNQKLSQSKKMELLERKRLGLPDIVAPRVVSIIKLSQGCDTSKIREMLLNKFKIITNENGMEVETAVKDENQFPTVSITSKVRMMLLECPSMEYDQVIEYCKLSDIILFVVDANQEKLNSEAERIFSIVKAQAVPTVMELIQNLDLVPQKKKNDVKKSIQSVFHFHFPDEPKVLPIDTVDECNQVLRYIENIHVNEIIWRKVRPYLLIEKASYIEDTKTVTIDGFLRGNNLSAKQIIHIPDFGDFQISKIESIEDPHIRRKSYYSSGNNSSMDQDSKTNVLDSSEPNERDTLQTWNVPDPLDAEQSLPTEEEIEQSKKKKLVPKGTSSYQSSWYLDNDEEEENFENENMDGDDDMMNEEPEQEEEEEEEEENDMIDGDDGDDEPDELVEVKESNKWKGIKHKHQITDDLLKSDDEDDEKSENEDEEIQDEDERKRLQDDEMLYPDEVDTPGNVPSRVRFSRYRGLKSFRSSPWDPKENLPIDYAKIFQFHSFNQSMKASVTILQKAPVKPDMYVRIHLVNGPKELTEREITSTSIPAVAVGLYRYENKVSLLHFSIEKHKSFEDTVKSKDEVFFHFGWRKFSTNPIYSISSPNCDKQKFEKFLLPGRNTMATIFGPITYPPAPLLIFNGKECNELIATGHLSSVNPDRIICKRIILTGVVAKSLSKKFVTVKDMFYYPEDINWFKKIELYTKMGRIGHIKEPLGTHGRMKCIFDGTMHQQDTICMNLYKRVYPKWIDENSNLLRLE